MKFILCSVFLAHGAAVYAICSTPAVGLVGSMDTCNTATINFCPWHQIKTPITHHKQKVSLPSKQGRGSKTASHKKNLCGPGYEQGWCMTGNIDLSTPTACTIHITVNAKGTILDWTVTPTVALDVYQHLDRQIQKLSFTWIGSSPPPDQTIFEKKFVMH